MKVLFIASGNNKGDIVSPIVLNQARSLEKKGLSIKIFPILGKGAWGYIKNWIRLKRLLRKSSFDVIHAHYQFSGYLAALALAKPLVVSLMGSEVTKSKKLSIVKYFIRNHWSATIVKTPEMKSMLSFETPHVIPNGVDFTRFQPQDNNTAKKTLTWSLKKKHILFAACPNRSEKNYMLAKEAVNSLANKDIVLHALNNIPNDLTPTYFNAADIVILTSFREGSPNVIKEAMACNRPIIATDVGDIKQIIGDTENCFVCDFDANQIAEKITYLLKYKIQSTNGREKIQHLSDLIVADRIISLYKHIVTHEE